MSAFAINEWQNYSVPFPIRDAAAADEDGVWLATDGGVRYKDSVNDFVFTPARGLEASSFYGVVNTPKGVFAVSEFGLIARLNEDFYGWKVLNRSFTSGNVRVVPGQVEHAEDVIVIAFENKIAFVDMETGKSMLSIERIGDVALSVYGPEKIGIRGDSLYVTTSRGTLARRMDWKELKDDVRLVDPETWSHVTGVCLDCRDSLKVVVDGKTLKDSILYVDDRSAVLWQFDEGRKTYLVGSDLIARYENGKLVDMTKYEPFQLSDAYEVQAIPEGGVIAASRDGYISANTGSFWYDPVMAFLGYGSNMEAFSYRMKVLSVLPQGWVIHHIWGMGFHLYWSMGYEPFYNILPWDDNCMDRVLPNFTVVVGTTVAPDKSGFLAATSAAEGRYGVNYITTDANISCANGVGDSLSAGPIAARMASDNSDWIVYVSTRETFSAFATGGLDIFRFQSPSRNGGRLLNPERKSIEGLDGKTAIDMAVDEDREVLWLVTATGIGYMEFDKDSIRKPVSMNGLLGAEYTSIDVDPQGNVWVGTAMQGVYRLERRNGSFDTLSATHYTMTDGLLNNAVLDISIDKTNGVIWMAHENGVSSFYRSDLRESKTFMTDSAEADVKVYPVPFRPGDNTMLKIDNISKKARVDIYNRGGSLIRSFVGGEVAGGRVEWDGRGKNGNWVAPGVYYYVVRAGKKVKKGKFIVIH